MEAKAIIVIIASLYRKNAIKNFLTDGYSFLKKSAFNVE